MRILWFNPSFLDYRVPLYYQLYKKALGEFYIAYSSKRNPKRVNAKIKELLGDNAINFDDEKLIKIGKKSDFANSSLVIPWQKGLIKRTKDIKPDIIITEGYFQWTMAAYYLSIKLKIPIMIAYERTEHTERMAQKWRVNYRKYISSKVSGFLVNGELTKKYIKDVFGQPEDRIYVGAMCADSKSLSKSVSTISKEVINETLKKHNIGQNNLIFIYVGQLIERKGVKYLLDGWKEYIGNNCNSVLVIVGDGYLKKELKSKVDKEGIENVIMVGHVDYSEIYKYYAISNVFVLPTLEDNWSLVVPEAMACGLPVATSIYNGCWPELIKKENGKVFDPLEKKQVIEVLEYFTKNQDKLLEMGKESKKIESQYSPENVAKIIYNACESIVNNVI